MAPSEDVDDGTSCGCGDELAAALLDAVRIAIGQGEIVITIRSDALGKHAGHASNPDELVAPPAPTAAVPAGRGRSRSRATLSSRGPVTFVGLGLAPADKYRGGYSQVQMRQDLVEPYTAALQTVHALGGMLTSSGGIRDVKEKATAGRSKTSLHYTGRAIDLFIYSGMQGGEEPYLVTRAGGSDANPEWEVYCVSRSPLTTHPRYDASLIAERDVECVRWVEGEGYRTFTRRATCFSLTRVMAKYGWMPIPARGNWKSEYLSCEWWHFQNASGLIDGVSTFGDQLLQVWREDLVRQSGLALGAIWAGRSFRASGTPATAPPPIAAPDAAEKVLWTQAILNAVGGETLSVDGTFGERSRDALVRFQSANSIPTSGALDATTEIALLQRALERLDARRFPRIGVIDEATVRAVSAFQRAHALKVDGRAGAKTRAAMVVALAGRPRSAGSTRGAAKRTATRRPAAGSRRGVKRTRGVKRPRKAGRTARARRPTR